MKFVIFLFSLVVGNQLASPLASTTAFSSSLGPKSSLASLSSFSTIPRDTTCDVAVVGAGPAGLVLAHALRNLGYSVNVLERRDSFRPVGSAVFLHPFALLSLQSISTQVAQNLIDSATQIGTLSVRYIENDKNNLILDKFDDAPERLGAPFVVIKFWDMLKALKKGLPDDIFYFGHDVKEFKELEDGRIQLDYYYTNGGSFGSCAAGMVIDAGGIRSNLRKQVVQAKSIPRCKAYMAVVPAADAKSVMKETPMVNRELAFFQGKGVAMTMATLKNGDVWWTYTCLTDNLDTVLSKEEILERMEIFPPFIFKLVEITDNFLETTIAELPVAWKWGQGNVTLLGDAAHAQMPALGLGCSTAFADIEELCVQIDKCGLTSKALRGYERTRMPQTALLQIMSRLVYFGVRLLG